MTLPRSRVTLKDNQKRDEFSWELAIPSRTHWEQPAFLHGHILGPSLIGTKPSSQDTKWDKQEGSSCTQERKDWQPVEPKSKSLCHKFKNRILQFFLPANLNLGRREQNRILPPSLTRHHRQKSRKADFGKNSCHLPASASFPRILCVGYRGGGVSQLVSSWSPETMEEEKLSSFSPLW